MVVNHWYLVDCEQSSELNYIMFKYISIQI